LIIHGDIGQKGELKRIQKLFAHEEASLFIQKIGVHEEIVKVLEPVEKFKHGADVILVEVSRNNKAYIERAKGRHFNVS
jgi:hypothetical protein